MASLTNSKWQTRKEHQNGCTNNVDMVEKAKRDVMSEEGIECHLIKYRDTWLLKLHKERIW